MEQLLMAFIVGGIICVIGQLLMDLTPLLPAHVLVLFVVLGAILSAVGWYQPLIEMGGAGATIPLPGFGHSLVQGTLSAVRENGCLGIFSGAIKTTASGITAAMVFGLIMAIVFRPKD